MTEVYDVKKIADHLERIIGNLNQHWSSIELLLSHVSKPLLVDDRGLADVLRVLKEDIWRFKEQVAILDLSHTLGEIKYIGNRLNNIEKILEDMKKDGIKKNIHLDFTIDGYEMVKKKPYEVPGLSEDPDIIVKELLSTLTSRESSILIHKLGLLGEKKKTYKEMSQIFKITAERCSMIFKKVCRKLRHPIRDKFYDRMTHKELKNIMKDTHMLQK